jgi:hypothetical protein
MNQEQEKTLRESIRHLIRGVKQKRVDNENKLRSLIRQFALQEMQIVEKTGIGSIEPPSDSTGLNKLDSVLNTIVPNVERFYKELTTDEEQRRSFRAHYLRSIMKELLPIDLNQDAADEASEGDEGIEEGLNEEADFKLRIMDDETEPDMSKFRPLGDMDKEPEDEKEEESDEQKFSRELGLEDEEMTGRDFAMDAWEATKGVILPVYAKLHNEKDSSLFYDYLITNMKVWFNIFDDQMAKSVTEPESQVDYETKGAGAGQDEIEPEEAPEETEPDEQVPELSFEG